MLIVNALGVVHTVGFFQTMKVFNHLDHAQAQLLKLFLDLLQVPVLKPGL